MKLWVPPPAAVLNSAARGLAAVARFFGEGGRANFDPAIPLMYLLLLVNGFARAFGWAARSPFVANLVPRHALANAVTWGSSNFEIGSMIGPALGGIVIAQFGFGGVYLLDVFAASPLSPFFCRSASCNSVPRRPIGRCASYSPA
jgi:sugar phosphate permease